MVSTDEADSDEDAADDFQPCTITVGHALERIQALSEFVDLICLGFSR